MPISAELSSLSMMDQGGGKRRMSLAISRTPSFGVVHRPCLYVLDLFSRMVFHISVPPDRGRSHEAHANGEGCGACRFGLASWASGGLGRHCPAQLRGSVGATRLVGVDERGGKPAESRAFRLSAAPVRFQKAVSGSK
jgi:hypothetical protein